MLRSVFVVLLLVGLSTVGVVAGTTVVDLDGDEIPAVRELDAGTDPLTADSDADGVGDGRERTLGTDPTSADTDGDGLPDAREVDEATSSTSADTDDDGLSDAKEVDGPTDATNADTDGDGLSDAEEVDGSTDSTESDTDGDGLSDPEEVDGPTDPTEADTDSDELSDGRERTFDSDPTLADTDGDGLSDGAEAEFGSDPTKTDTDGDGLTDDREQELDLNATAPDTDDDGLSDPEEVDGSTDPTEPDTDFDQLIDGREYEVGTDPTDPDTDLDGLQDGWEVADETPLGVELPNADPLRMDMYVRIHYPEGATRLSNQQLQYIRHEWAGFDVENPDGTTGISVHIDDTQPEAGRLSRSHVVGDNSDYNILENLYDTDDYYHNVLVLEVASSADFVGYGDIGGLFSIADHHENPEEVIVHELLHNVVGKLDPDHQCGGEEHHTCRGWLRAHHQPFLVDELLEELQRDGLAPSFE